MLIIDLRPGKKNLINKKNDDSLLGILIKKIKAKIFLLKDTKLYHL